MFGKKNNNIIIIGVVLILIIACIMLATGVLNFKAEKDDEDNNKITDLGTANNMQDDDLDPWMSYLLKQNITSIKLNRSDAENNLTIVELTKQDLKKIFAKFMSYQIAQSYTLGTGFTFGDDLTITYTLNGNSYQLSILEGDICVQYDNKGDNGLVNALLESGYTVENENIKDQEGAFYYYIIKRYDSSILDEFVE